MNQTINFDIDRVRAHSYSNEAEDLILKRIFDVVIQKNDVGFYVDIGAHHPVEHSNTYLFYERGWRGVCVEPNPEFRRLHTTYRPQDQFVNSGISSITSVLKYHRFDESQENGFFGDDHVAARIADNRAYLGYTNIDCLSVLEFLQTYVDKPVDLLSIDVETKEPEILGAWDWKVCRPTVICVEVHTRDLQTVLQSDVMTILSNVGYMPVSRGLMSAMFVLDDRL